MPSQRRRIQRLRVQKLREEVTEKERDEHFNVIQPMIPMKQEWRVKGRPPPLHLRAPMTTWTYWTMMSLR
jgi:hypothetical protein